MQALAPVREQAATNEFGQRGGAGAGPGAAGTGSMVGQGQQAQHALPPTPQGETMQIRRSMSINQGPPPANGPPGAKQQLHPEIRSVVQLSVAHAHKVYFSGPLVKHVERQTDGKLVGKDDAWRDVWAQLGGTTLSIWDMKEIEEANKRGEEVPPTYLNITDAVRVLFGSAIHCAFTEHKSCNSAVRACSGRSDDARS